jgi:DNA-binding IclR family transcriptional regulator
VNGEGVTIAALTTCIPVSRITPERHDTIVADLMRLGIELSDAVRWLPSFSSRRS